MIQETTKNIFAQHKQEVQFEIHVAQHGFPNETTRILKIILLQKI